MGMRRILRGFSKEFELHRTFFPHLHPIAPDDHTAIGKQPHEILRSLPREATVIGGVHAIDSQLTGLHLVPCHRSD